MAREPAGVALQKKPAGSSLVRQLPRVYRVMLLAAVVWFLHLAAGKPPERGELTLRDAQRLFPNAIRLDERLNERGGQAVHDAAGNLLGTVLTTSPQADNLIGYSGPSNVLVALDAEGKILGLEILASGDTTAHVEEVRRSNAFWKQLIGWQPATKAAPAVDGVSGSTLTSLAMAEGVARRLRGSGASLRFAEAVTLDEARVFFPEAQQIVADKPRAGWHRVMDERGKLVGYAVRSSPYSDNVRGYQGPTETLIAVSADGKRLLDVRLRKSYDTPEYVDRVREDDDYRKLLSNRTTDQWATIDYREAGIEGVSGATQTSFAVAEGIRRRFATDRVEPDSRSSNRFATPGLVAIIAGALALTFTPLRTQRQLRWIWNGILIVAFAWWIGDLLSLSLLAGWARHGIAWQTSPAVVLLVAVALVVPWTTRRNVYCQHICPHGAAQNWLGRFKRLHVRIPPTWNRWLGRMPLALLAVGIGLALFVVGFDLAWLEPFDAWVLKGAAAVSATIAVVGLIASLFVPQAYCRFGCPTGALLNFTKSGGGQDRLHRRDVAAGLLLVVAAVVLLAQRWLAIPSRDARLHVPADQMAASAPDLAGAAFGTRWSVKLRNFTPHASLKADLAEELERIESTLSHWRPDSATAQFNASETTFEMEQPAELIELVAQAQELSRATDGAYDITVAPLVAAWGFGPTGEIDRAPSDERLAELLATVGWQRLTVRSADNTLQKAHPQLQIDLGSLLQGHAADRLAWMLDKAGAEEYLIDVGGELVARGPWKVAIENPIDPSQPLRTIQLTDQALATSALHRTARQADGRAVHHLISPQTGRPIVATAQLCAILAPTGLEADAWATALLALGLPDALPLADERGLKVLMLDNEGRVRWSERGESHFDKGGQD